MRKILSRLSGLGFWGVVLLLAAVAGVFFFGEDGTKEFYATKFGQRLFAALLAIAVLRLVLLWFDKLMGRDFNKIFEEMSPDARGDYLGKRYIGCSIIIGLIIAIS